MSKADEIDECVLKQTDDDYDTWECSNCKEIWCFGNEFSPKENNYNYCPNCGTKFTAYEGFKELGWEE